MTHSEKSAAVHRVQEHLAGGRSLNAACAAAGVPKASYLRWKAKLDNHGVIRDRRAVASGRRPKFSLTAEETAALRGLTLKHGSFAFAVEVFARSPQCRAATAEMILDVLTTAAAEQRQAKFPASLYRAAAPTEMEEDLLRGPKAAGNHAVGSVKGLFWEDEDGERRPMRPMSTWVLDDYSANQPYQAQDRLCRQVLAGLDLYPSAWIGFHHVGRERDAYRAEDILRFILNLIDGHGTMPENMMLEKGRWDSIAIHGVEMPDNSGRCWGALDDLFRITHGFTSRFKAALESNFRILQTALRLSGRDIGSYRGEFEKATDAVARVNAGKADAGAAGFLTQDESSLIHAEAGQYLNGRPKMRRALGGRHLIPDTLSAEPWTPRPLPESERWRFYPIKRLATIRGNFVEVRAEHYDGHFIFRVNGIDDAVHFQPGHRVFLAFDPLNPHLGAVIGNADTSSKNRESWRMGQLLLTAAPLWEMTPQFSFRPRSLEMEPTRKAAAAVRAAFRAIKPFCKPGLAVVSRHDGQGRGAEIRQNDFSPRPEIAATTPRMPLAESADRVPGVESGGALSSPSRGIAPRQARNSPVAPDPDETALAELEAAILAEG